MIGFCSTRYVNGDAAWLVRCYPWLVLTGIIASAAVCTFA